MQNTMGCQLYERIGDRACDFCLPTNKLICPKVPSSKATLEVQGRGRVTSFNTRLAASTAAREARKARQAEVLENAIYVLSLIYDAQDFTTGDPTAAAAELNILGRGQ